MNQVPEKSMTQQFDDPPIQWVMTQLLTDPITQWPDRSMANGSMARSSSGDSRSGEQRRCHHRRSATQAGVFSGLRRLDRVSGGGLGQGPLGQCGAKCRLHQAPCFGYLAADIDTLGVQAVHYHSQPKAQVTCSSLNVADSARVAGTGPGDQIVDSECALHSRVA